MNGGTIHTTLRIATLKDPQGIARKGLIWLYKSMYDLRPTSLVVVQADYSGRSVLKQPTQEELDTLEPLSTQRNA